MRCANGYNMPSQVVEAVASSGRYTRTHAVPTGYTCTPKRRKSLIYKHSIIILIFKVHKEKHIKICLMLAAGIEPTKPQQAKKGATCAPLVFNILAMRKAATCSSLLHLRIFRKTQTCSLQKCARL